MKDTIIDDKVSFCFINNEDNKLYSLVIDNRDSGSGDSNNYSSCCKYDGYNDMIGYIHTPTRCITPIMNECAMVTLDT